MPRINLRGLHHATKRLADGRKVTYWYAWRNGPRLPGTPGEPEFMAAYAKAIESAQPKHAGILQHVLNAYQESTEFLDKAPRTRAHYVQQIRKIESAFGTLPIAALADRRVRGDFKEWRDWLATASRRQADYAFTVLALILAWAYDRGRVPANPCERSGRLYRSTRVESVWSDEKALLEVAPEHTRLAFLLAIWTGLRQGDLLRLPWSAYDGETIRIRQGKTKGRVSVPLAAPLKRALDGTPRRAITILTISSGTSWTEDGFRSSRKKACRRAKLSGITFHDLRGTAVTRLALAGCTEA